MNKEEAPWSVRAGDIEWDCRARVLHIASDFVGYATQLTAPRTHGYAPFDLVLEGAPDPSELRDVVRATGGVLSAVIRTADSTTLSWHPYGIAGPADFAAMGIVEILVHTEDLSRGLGFPWEPPAELCARVLQHLFLAEHGFMRFVGSNLSSRNDNHYHPEAGCHNERVEYASDDIY